MTSSIIPIKNPLKGRKVSGQVIRRNKFLSTKIHSTFDPQASSKTLPELCFDLLSEQKETWKELREGYELLKEVRERSVPFGGFSVRLQYNPGRMKSSTAHVGERDVKKRPCLLCPDHLPEGQKGIFHRSEYLILCNPMPVFSSHLTVSHLDHRPQSIFENIETFLHLSLDFGSGWTLLYNGPKCGASAPDHLHFQAIPSGAMPIEKETTREKRLSMTRKVENVSLHRVLEIGREVIILEGDDRAAVGNVFKSLLNGLKRILHIQAPTDEEPMVNIAGFYHKRKWRLLIFPRRKHRPDIYFKEGDERVVVSPGAIDMGGVLITPSKKDFERLNAAGIEGIYREVSLEDEIVESAMDALGSRGNS